MYHRRPRRFVYSPRTVASDRRGLIAILLIALGCGLIGWAVAETFRYTALTVTQEDHPHG